MTLISAIFQASASDDEFLYRSPTIIIRTSSPNSNSHYKTWQSYTQNAYYLSDKDKLTIDLKDSTSKYTNVPETGGSAYSEDANTVLYTTDAFDCVIVGAVYQDNDKIKRHLFHLNATDIDHWDRNLSSLANLLKNKKFKPENTKIAVLSGALSQNLMEVCDLINKLAFKITHQSIFPIFLYGRVKYTLSIFFLWMVCR